MGATADSDNVVVTDGHGGGGTLTIAATSDGAAGIEMLGSIDGVSGGRHWPARLHDRQPDVDDHGGQLPMPRQVP